MNYRSLRLSAALLASMPGLAHAAAIGPTAYLQASDSPIAGAGYSYFHLETFEDNSFNVPGVTGSGGCITGAGGCFGTSLTDSVDADDGPVDGTGLGGRSLWNAGSVSFTFDAAVLGQLPNAAGLVWTDGGGTITFEAFDQDGVSLGTISGDHADGSFTGGTAEDRFYGWTLTSGGISRIAISNSVGGIEVDHLQYGLRAVKPPPNGVPEPGSVALLGLALAGLAIARRSRPS